MIQETTNREERFISKLIKDTQNGEIEWETDDTRITLPSSERRVSKIYRTEINGKNLRLYEYNIKYFRDEDEWDWVERVRLEIIDEENDSIFEFGYDYSLYKLYYAIRKASSGADEFMKEFLNE